MNFDLSEEQQLFRDAIERFLGPIDIAERRRLRAAPGRYPAARWQEVAELGLLALAAPEAMGGLGGSRIDLTLAAEAMGHGLAIDPWLENGVLPIRLAAASGDIALVQRLSSGEVRCAMAFAEPGRRYSLEPRLRADAQGRLSGAKTFVLGGPGTDVLFVTATGTDGAFLYAVAADTAGVTQRSYTLVDGSVAGELQLFDTPAQRLEIGFHAFMDVVGDIRLLAAAEMVGLMQRLFDDTLAYVKQREQFGVPIGSFQALQHRLVDCYAQLELARSLVLRTALEPADDWAAKAAGTKAHVGAAAMHVAEEAVQLHGGMGQTDDVAVGHALKRVMLLDKLFGDASNDLIDFARAA